MVDNKKKKKHDRYFIALSQRGERNYMRKIAEEQLELLKEQKGTRLWGQDNGCWSRNHCSKPSLIRITKAMLKLLSVYEARRKRK